MVMVVLCSNNTANIGMWLTQHENLGTYRHKAMIVNWPDSIYFIFAGSNFASPGQQKRSKVQ